MPNGTNKRFLSDLEIFFQSDGGETEREGGGAGGEGGISVVGLSDSKRRRNSEKDRLGDWPRRDKAETRAEKMHLQTARTFFIIFIFHLSLTKKGFKLQVVFIAAVAKGDNETRPQLLDLRLPGEEGGETSCSGGRRAEKKKGYGFSLFLPFSGGVCTKSGGEIQVRYVLEEETLKL